MSNGKMNGLDWCIDEVVVVSCSSNYWKEGLKIDKLNIMVHLRNSRVEILFRGLNMLLVYKISNMIVTGDWDYHVRSALLRREV